MDKAAKQLPIPPSGVRSAGQNNLELNSAHSPVEPQSAPAQADRKKAKRHSASGIFAAPRGLSRPLIFEGDFQLGAVGDNLAVFNHEILLDNLGYPHVP